MLDTVVIEGVFAFPAGYARHRARRCTQVRRRTVVSNCALPSSPSQRMRAAGSRPPPFRRRRCLDLLLLLLYLSAVAGASPASAFAVSAFAVSAIAVSVAARARPCGSYVALANGLRDGRNVLGPAHSGFLWCMTWSMAAMGIRTRDRTRMSNAGAVAASAASAGKRARELKNVYAANV